MYGEPGNGETFRVDGPRSRRCLVSSEGEGAVTRPLEDVQFRMLRSHVHPVAVKRLERSRAAANDACDWVPIGLTSAHRSLSFRGY